MKRIISFILVCSLLLSMTACAQSPAEEPTQLMQPTEITNTEENETIPSTETKPAETQVSSEPAGQIEENPIPEFSGLNDPAFLQYIEENLPADLTESFSEDTYRIESVEAIYISKEYLEELEYNSLSNVFFGYTLAELDEQFQGSKYVFTLDETGQTVVQPFEAYEDIYIQILNSTVVEYGVVVICVVASLMQNGVDLGPVRIELVLSPKTDTMKQLTKILSSKSFSQLTLGLVEGVRTGNYDTAKKAALAISKDIVWSAISAAKK